MLIELELSRVLFAVSISALQIGFFETPMTDGQEPSNRLEPRKLKEVSAGQRDT